jgi:hypothetical protein
MCSLEPPSASSEAAEEERPMDGMGAVGEVTTAAGEAAAAPPLTSMPALDALWSPADVEQRLSWGVEVWSPADVEQRLSWGVEGDWLATALAALSISFAARSMAASTAASTARLIPVALMQPPLSMAASMTACTLAIALSAASCAWCAALDAAAAAASVAAAASTGWRPRTARTASTRAASAADGDGAEDAAVCSFMYEGGSGCSGGRILSFASASMTPHTWWAWRQFELIRGHQRPSEAIRAHQSSSEAIRQGGD